MKISIINNIRNLSLLFLLLFSFNNLKAQQQDPLTLDQVIKAALENNNLLRINKLQVSEQDAKIKQAEINRYPKLLTYSAYQYSQEIAKINIPIGTFGALPINSTTTIPLPDVDKSLDLTNHNNFLFGLTAYQPLTQLGKINTGIKIAELDRNIAEVEQYKLELQIKNGVEQYFFGILAVRKRKEEAEKKIEVENLKLYDVKSALLAGKAVTLNEMGLNANIADKEQELLKLKFEEEDLIAELKKLTGLKQDQLVLAEVDVNFDINKELKDYMLAANDNNIDLKLVKLEKSKSELGLKAAKQNFLPDFGFFAGYNYQQGFNVLPENNVFLGAIFSWDLQSILSNKQVVKQRKLINEQVLEKEKYSEKQVSVSVEKAYRKLKQFEELINVTKKAVTYREAELKIENDRMDSGLNERIKVLEIEAELSKSKADFYGAVMGYNMALAELNKLTN